MYSGHFAVGLLLCLSAIWLLHEGILLEKLIPGLCFPSPLPGAVRYPVTLLVGGALYVYSAQRSWRRHLPKSH